jgi:hypothetical protein
MIWSRKGGSLSYVGRHRSTASLGNEKNAHNTGMTAFLFGWQTKLFDYTIINLILGIQWQKYTWWSKMNSMSINFFKFSSPPLSVKFSLYVTNFNTNIILGHLEIWTNENEEMWIHNTTLECIRSRCRTVPSYTDIQHSWTVQCNRYYITTVIV